MATVAPTNLHPLVEMAINFWEIDPELVLHLQSDLHPFGGVHRVLTGSIGGDAYVQL